MVTIWEFRLPTRGSAEVEIQKGARILSVENQHDEIVLWARVDTTNVMVPRRFYVARSREDLEGKVRPKDAFIGTVLLSIGQIAAHVFEVLS